MKNIKEVIFFSSTLEVEQDRGCGIENYRCKACKNEEAECSKCEKVEDKAKEYRLNYIY